MSSDPSGPAFSPLYQQIKLLITRSLQDGEWKPGEAIPAETDLAARYRVSQGTVRKAIDELATENLVVRRQGKGTFVATHAEEQIQYRFLRLAPDDGKPQGHGAPLHRLQAHARARARRARARPEGRRGRDPRAAHARAGRRARWCSTRSGCRR